MKQRFEQRIGLEPVRSAIQVESLDEPTRIDLWNSVVRARKILAENAFSAERQEIADQLWSRHLRYSLDELRSADEAWHVMRTMVINGEWWEALSAIDAIAESLDRAESVRGLRVVMSDVFNEDLASNLVPYRFVDGLLAPFQTAAEARAVDQALSDAAPFAGVRKHLRDAIDALAQKPVPETARSAAASIHAVEAVVRAVTGAKTLSDGLKKLDGAGVTMHPAFRTALDKLYAYTSDDAGVRHGSIDPATVDRATAMFMLVTCSAFTSWLIDEGLRAKLLTSSPR